MVFVDASDNVCVGNCIYSNADFNYPTRDYFQAETPANWQTEMTAFFNALGVNYSNLSNSITDNNVLYRWSPVGDTVANNSTKRFEVRKGEPSHARMFDNTGANIASTSQQIGMINCSFFTACGNSDNIGLFAMTQNTIRQETDHEFYYQGVLDNVNTIGNGYYSNEIVNKSILIYSKRGYTQIVVRHYIDETNKQALTNGRADYSIICAGQTTEPTFTVGWGTDFWVFDNDSALNFPVIGRAKNLILAEGTEYIIGKPTRFGIVDRFGAGVFNSWLPVGKFAGKTLLMRCYSSSLVP